jgi:hypothetical protein
VRRLLISALVGSLAATSAFLLPAAHANSQCGLGPGGVTVPPTGSGTLTVGTPIGCVTASGDATTASGYVVADGDPTNPTPLDGYIGVQGSGGGVQVVGCASNDYDPNPGNPDPTTHNVIWDSNNPTGGGPDTTGPCAAP